MNTIKKMKRPIGVWCNLLLLLIVFVPSASSAERTITGTIWMPDGSPADNVIVVAWDEDKDPLSMDDDELMAHTTTNSKGEYIIRYERGPYDPRLPGGTGFRPDIFLRVFFVQSSDSSEPRRMLSQHILAFSSSVPGASVAGTEWLVYNVKKTITRENWRMSENLPIDITLPGIVGRVTYLNDIPADGVVLRAFDKDHFESFKPLSQTITSPDGRYFMLLPHGHADMTPPNPIGTITSVAMMATGVGTVVPAGLIADAITDSAWDSVMDELFTSWRPDIVIRVYSATGEIVAQSDVYEDQRLRETITFDAVVPNAVFDVTWFVPLMSH